jgi:glucose dehydrogenase
MRLTQFLLCSLAAAGAGLIYGQSDWPVYGGDSGNTRYSALDQINIQNVTKLARAWVYDTRPQGNEKIRSAQATPLVVNGVMYQVTAYQSLVALEAETGRQIWIYKHQFGGRPPRGIAYWPGDKTNPPEILFGTWEGYLIALDAKTGKPVSGFGKNGAVDLKVGMKDKYPDVHYGLSGAPVIYKDLAITGSHTQDSPSLGSRGDARAWDLPFGAAAGREGTRDLAQRRLAGSLGSQRLDDFEH